MVILLPSSQGVVNWRPIAQGVPPAPSCKVKPVPDAANAVFLPHKIQLLDFDGSGLGRAAVRPTLTREERRCRDCSACRNTGSFAFRARPWGTEPPLPLAGSQVFGISPPTVCLCGCCRDRFSHNCDVIISSWLGVSSPGGAFDLSQTLQWSNGCWVVFPSQSSFPPRNNRDVCGPRPPPPDRGGPCPAPQGVRPVPRVPPAGAPPHVPDLPRRPQRHIRLLHRPPPACLGGRGDNVQLSLPHLLYASPDGQNFWAPSAQSIQVGKWMHTMPLKSAV